MSTDTPTTFGPSAVATPANAVTLVRVLATPVLMALVVSDGATWLTVSVWFLIASTDGLDGFVARKMGATRSGAFLDPLADKVCVLGAMVALVSIETFWWVPVALIAVRELGLIAYRFLLARRGVSMPATPGAKLKTVVQSLAVGAALLPATASHAMTATAVLWIAVALTLITGGRYLAEGQRAFAA